MEKYVLQTDHRKGITYKTLAISLVIVVLVCAGVCAAIVVPLFNNMRRSEEVGHTNTPTSSPEPDKTFVNIDCGRIQGTIEEGVHVFKGIPYAQPPTGTLRWKPPIATSPHNNNCWNGTYSAGEFGNVCFQSLGGIVGSEDCLYLNVFTPTTDNSSLLPVMLYIHGGSLMHLSGNTPGLCPDAKLASNTQMVYVSLNYRLNMFGFLALDLLTKDSFTNSSGNYGFMDQQMALYWVKRNIRQFGGNPALVTVFGESSGGTSVLALLASPLSRGLFQRAWLMSSSVVMNKTLAQVSLDNLSVLNKTGCSDLHCLYDLTAQQVYDAMPYNDFPRWYQDDAMNIPTKGLFPGAMAIIDGYLLREEPLTTFRAGRGMDVPVVISTLAQETSMVEVTPGVRTWTWDNYTHYVHNKLEPFGDVIADTALDLYPPSVNVTPEEQLTTLSTDIRVTCPNKVLSDALSAPSEMRVYRYVITSHPSIPMHIFGFPYKTAYSFHAWDIMVLFNDLKTFFKNPSSENIAFKQIQEQEMIYFAKYGYPSTTPWWTYPNRTAVISNKVSVSTHYHKDQCEFWLNNGFFSYGWMN